jgi:octaprenyl-diphosphate synthase
VVEGKKSLPVILHLEKHPEDIDFLASAFARARNEGISSSAVETVIDKLTSSGSVESARQYGAKLIQRSCLTLRGRYPGHEATELIAGLFESMLDGIV